MVVGDVFADMQTATFEDEVVTIIAPHGYEYEITNLYVDGAVRLIPYGAVDAGLIEIITESQIGISIHVTEINFITLDAVSTNVMCAWDGIVTRRPPTVFA